MEFNRRWDDVDEWTYNRNPYYNPEKCGLDLISVIDVPNLSYEYDTIILVRDQETGEFFAAQNSGCSCPMPFEDFRGLADMTHITSVEDFDNFVNGYSGSEYYVYDAAQVADARRALHNLLP